MEIGIIGLGKMGNALALHALKSGIKVLGFSHQEISSELKENGFTQVNDVEDLIKSLKSPRKIFLYVPAGEAVEDYVHKFSYMLSPGDIVADGGNSYWGDSKRRHDLLIEKNIYWVDLGTSGGISGASDGACFLVGGDKEAYDQIQPILEILSIPEGHAYIGPSGCGHLVKLIHNGIEFGMLQAIGEGMALLEKFKETMAFDMEAVFKTYRHGSVIRSWLIDLMNEQYQARHGMSSTPPYIEDTGEVNWLISDALHLEVPIPVISQSVMELFRSRDKDRIDYRSIAMMRHGFGGHPFGEMLALKKERLTSRISSDFGGESYEH